MEALIKQSLLEHSDSLFGTQVPEKMIQFQKTRKDVEGDLTLVIFPFVKMLKMSPVDAGNKIGEFLVDKIDAIDRFEIVSGFLNFVISDSYWLNRLNEIDASDRFGYNEPDSRSRMMVEYSSPNTNKPLHLGHLRNIFLGYSVSELLKAVGHKVVKTQIINDRGIHICKSMLAWERFSPTDENGERETPANSDLKGDKLVGKYYVEFDKQMNSEAAELLLEWNEGRFGDLSDEKISEVQKLQSSRQGKGDKVVDGINSKIKEIAKNETSLMKDAKVMLIKWEARDPQVYLLWTTMNGWVYEGFDKTYTTMGVDFDKLYYESDTFLLGKDLVAEGLEKGVFFRKDDGSVWIDLTEDGLDEKILLRSDGTAVYMTQDVGTAVDRYRDYPDLNGIIYTVGNEQDYHFKVLFLILDKLGYDWAKNCYHLSYGMVELRNSKGEVGKMKSREGTVVDADDLMQDVVDAATEMTQERGHIADMSDEQREQLYSMIGLGGLKYYLLKVDPRKGMVFNPEESIELNGNTGPFVQYAHARIKSLLRKAPEIEEMNTGIELGYEEKELIKHLNGFPSVIEEAASSYSPSLVINYIYELVKMYNQFYQSFGILKEENAVLRNMRLILSRNVAKVIQLGMKPLGINVPEQM